MSPVFRSRQRARMAKKMFADVKANDNWPRQAILILQQLHSAALFSSFECANTTKCSPILQIRALAKNAEKAVGPMKCATETKRVFR